jgi:hypothetical protein
MRRVLLAVLLLAGCGGSEQDAPAEAPAAVTAIPEAIFQIEPSHVSCLMPDQSFFSLGGGACEWRCAFHRGRAGHVLVLLSYEGGHPRGDVTVTPHEGCR